MRGLVPTVLLALCLVCVPATAEPTAESIPYIRVTGKATTKVAPDHIVWHVTLSDEESTDLAKARERVEQRLEQLFDLKRTLDIEDQDFETGHLNVRKDYRHTKQGRVFRAYVLTRQITIRQRDLGKFNEFLDALFEAREFEASFTFDTSKREDLVAATRLDAMKAAKVKAEAMAAAVDARVGRPLAIEEHPNPQPRPMTSNRMMVMQADAMGPGGGSPFMPGKLEITVTVGVTFALQ